MNKPKLILIGGGGHCKACIDVIEQEGRFEITGILDFPEKIGTEILGHPIIGSDDQLPELSHQYTHFFITVGQIDLPDARNRIFKLLKELKLEIPVIISPFAYVSRHAKISEGTIVMHHALVNAHASVGINCIINSKCLIEHDAQIGDHCHVSTSAIINGGVIVGDNCFVGTGAKILQYLTIGSDITIGAGAVVTKNLTEPGIYIGIPAKKL
jgi:sugar O-acyltransferase (sialic acid O-acetyltransferase NeuD family)